MSTDSSEMEHFGTYKVTDWREQLPPGASHRDVADVCIDSEDRVVLFTRDESAVFVYTSGGDFVASWGKEIFGHSHGITAGPDDSIYCVDDGHHVVRKFTRSGTLCSTIGVPDTPSQTGYDGRNLESICCSAGPFNRCTKLAVGPKGDLYVADGYGNARVHHFSSSGELVRSWGEPGIGPGQFHLPHGIWVAPDGRVLVADRENDRIQFFDPDGEYLDEWTDVHRPCAIQVGQGGVVYVAELLANAGTKSFTHGIRTHDLPGRVSVFGPDGTLLARWGRYGCEPGNFIAPHGIAVDSRGDVYVAEVVWTLAGRYGHVSPDCHQIQKFTRS